MKAPGKTAVITDPLENLLGFELRRASVAVMAALSDALEPLGLRPSEASMLMIIGSNPGSTQSDVGRALRVQPANMVPIINRLMLTGSLERIPTEGRSLSLFLTEQGRALFEQVKDIFASHEKRYSRHLSDEARNELVIALRSIFWEACQGRQDNRPA